MSSEKDAAKSTRRASSSSRRLAAPQDAVDAGHRGKRSSSRDPDGAHVIDASVPRARDRRGDVAVHDAVGRMRESASKVRAAVRQTPRVAAAADGVATPRGAVAKQPGVAARETKKIPSSVKTPTKTTELKTSSRTAIRELSEKSPSKLADSSRHRASETPLKKPGESSRHRASETPLKKTRESSRHRASETPLKKTAAPLSQKAVEKPERSKRTTEEGKTRRTLEEKEKEKASRHKRQAEDSPRDKAVRTHRKTEDEDKTVSKSRRTVGDAKEVSESRRRLAKEDKDLKPRASGDKSHRSKERTGLKEQPSRETKHRDGRAAEDQAKTAAGDAPDKPRERNRTRVLSPSEIKVAQATAQEAAQGGSRGGHRAGEIASTSREGQVPMSDKGDADADADADDDDYEDDFEEYESDFEEESSDDKDEGGDGSVVSELASRLPAANPEEEKKLDSGNYDLAETQKRSKYLSEIKAAMDKENSTLGQERRDWSAKETSSPVDEGFEEEKSYDLGGGGSIPRATSFINFANARKRQKEQEVTARARRRGEELLNMITLDIGKRLLFEMTPAPYDAFMSRCGRAGSAQASVQTNDDRLSEEVQTAEIAMRSAWTQRPATCAPGGDAVVRTTRQQELLGVGTEPTEDDAEPAAAQAPASLEDFLRRVAPSMLRGLLEGRSHRTLQPNAADVGFSRGFVQLRSDALPFLAGRAVTLVRYPPQQPSTLLTVHAAAGKPPDGDGDGDADAALRRCVICVWSVREPSAPLKTLASWREVTSACFESERATLVLAGLDDGAVCVWDLRDRRDADADADADAGTLMRSPTYSTAEVLKEEGHLGRVVSLQPLLDKDSDGMDEFSPTQVCSLEESGLAIVWTVIQSAQRGAASGAAQDDLGLAYWGRVRLVKTSALRLDEGLPIEHLLQPNLVFSDMQINSADCNHLFVSANTGQVVHCLKSGAKPTPRIYHPKSDGLTFAQCIETFPFGHSLFLVGCGDGSVRLHRRETATALTILAGTGDAPGQGPVIRGLQWSRSRPTVFFVLDDQSRIHVWDLGLSDMYPRLTATPTPTPAGVSAIQLAPDPRDGKTPPQLVIASSDGTIQIHELKDEYRFRSTGDMQKELNNFIRFTNIL